jgi:phospholipase/carboxylesterase
VGYQVALSYPKPLAGLLALSTYFAGEQRLVPSDSNRALPIRIYHGTADPVIPEFMAGHSRDALTKLGYQPVYKTYPMPHSVCLEQINDMAVWLRSTLL